MQKQLGKQLIKLIIYMCFCFFVCKNYNIRAAMPGASQANYIYVFLFFYL